MILINLQKAFDTIDRYLAFEIQVLSTSAIKAKANSELFSLPQQCVGKNCRRLSWSLCISRQQWLRHTSAFCQGLWFSFLTADTTYPTYIILFTETGRKREKQKFPVSCFPLITLFWFLCVSLLSQENPLFNTRKTWCSKYNSVWTKVSNTNWVITENKKNIVFEKNNRRWCRKRQKDWLKF